MNCHSTLLRFSRFSPLFAAVALAACTTPSAEDDGETGETGETGDPMVDQEACIDPGTELPNAKPARPPSEQNPVMFTCTSGWGTDAPQLDPEWSVQLGQSPNGFNFSRPAIAAHPDGGVLVVSMGEFMHVGADGELAWSLPVSDFGEHQLAIEEAGTILLAGYDWDASDSTLTRYDGAGESLGVVDIPWNSTTPALWGLATLGAEIIVAGYDEDMQGNYEATLIRMDSDGNLLLRKSTGMSGGELLVVTDGGIAMFGTVPGFLVAVDNGEVVGMLVPSSAGVGDVASFGDDFVMTGNLTGMTSDLAVGRYTSVGGEQWLQGYDRATMADVGRGIAAGPDGTIVAVGVTSMLDFSTSYWFNTQPVVFGVDADGNALWQDRISAQGEASAVAVGPAGDVYVVGVADAGSETDPQSEPPVMLWLRRYVP